MYRWKRARTEKLKEYRVSETPGRLCRRSEVHERVLSDPDLHVFRIEFREQNARSLTALINGKVQ